MGGVMQANNPELLQQLSAHVPQEMICRNQWVVWQSQLRKDKPTKVPYNPLNHQKASSTEPSNWASFEHACEAFLSGRYSGMGFVFSADDPFVGIDFDDCLENGKIAPDVLSHIHGLNSYTEYSQSGRGLHVILSGKLPSHGRKSTKHKIELYDNARFFVMTGAAVPEMPTEINDRQDALDEFYRILFEIAEQQSLPLTQHHKAEEIDDQAILAKMFASKHGSKIQALWNGVTSAYDNDHSSADQALCNHLSFWCNGDAVIVDRMFRSSGLMRPKWDRPARSGETYGQGTISRAVASFLQKASTQIEANISGINSVQTDADLPQIIVNNRQLPLVTEDALQALSKMNKRSENPFVYVRSGNLIRVVELDHGEHIVQILNDSMLKGILARSANWFKSMGSPEKAQLTSVFPQKTIAGDLISLGRWPSIPDLDSLTHSPTFVADGKLISDYGFCWDTGFFCASNINLDDTQPTTKNIEKSLKTICEELLADFPFDSMASEAHAIALLMLPFVRPMIAGPTPLHAIDAPTPGTGKGLLAGACSFPALGRDLASFSAPTNESEWRKRITAIISRADSHVLIDNINQPLDSASFAAALTQQIWADRLLGQSCTVTAPIKQIWIATANNLVVSDEIARRSIRIRLDANEERPDKRNDFQHPNLMKWVRDNRSELATAAITVIRAWVEEGMPRFTATRKGSYESWSEIIGGILATNGIEGFLANDNDLFESTSTETAQLVEFTWAWYQQFGEKAVTPKELLRVVCQPDSQDLANGQQHHQGLLDDVLGNGSEHSRVSTFGKFLSANRDRVIAGFKILKLTNDKSRTRYKLIKV